MAPKDWETLYSTTITILYYWYPFSRATAKSVIVASLAIFTLVSTSGLLLHAKRINDKAAKDGGREMSVLNPGN